MNSASGDHPRMGIIQTIARLGACLGEAALTVRSTVHQILAWAATLWAATLPTPLPHSAHLPAVASLPSHKALAPKTLRLRPHTRPASEHGAVARYCGDCHAVVFAAERDGGLSWCLASPRVFETLLVCAALHRRHSIVEGSELRGTRRPPTGTCRGSSTYH